MAASPVTFFLRNWKRVCPMKTPSRSPRPTVQKKASELLANPFWPARREAVCQPAPAGKILETATSAELDIRSMTRVAKPGPSKGAVAVARIPRRELTRRPFVRAEGVERAFGAIPANMLCEGKEGEAKKAAQPVQRASRHATRIFLNVHRLHEGIFSPLATGFKSLLSFTTRPLQHICAAETCFQIRTLSIAEDSSQKVLRRKKN